MDSGSAFRDDRVRRSALAAFLRERRARLRPQDVGLPAIGRRRVKGLRREEVAIVAGIGLTWYTLLETGAEINVSRESLERIGSALKLDGAERDVLIGLGHPEREAPPPAVVDDALRRCVAMIRSPAFVLSPCWDILFWNAAFAAAWRIDPPGSAPFNAVEFQFTGAFERGLHGERWHAVSRRMAAQFRADYLVHAGEPIFEELLERLGRIPRFVQVAAPSEVISPLAETPSVIEHPQLGRIDYTIYNLTLPGSGLILTVQLVSDDSAAALAQIAKSQTACRADSNAVDSAQPTRP